MVIYRLAFDIGKTNKKCVLFNDRFEMVQMRQKQFALIPGENDWEYEDSENIVAWMKECIEELRGHGEIMGVQVSAHGGAYALLNKQGELVLPVISYTSQFPAKHLQGFEEKFGDDDQVFAETSSPNLGGINLARSLYCVQQECPQQWLATSSILFWPQYLVYRLCGVMATELTFMGNHSCFWNFKKWTFSSIADALGVVPKLPHMVSHFETTLGHYLCEDLVHSIPIAIGVHDSNAALIPYFSKKPFSLLSTGSWCVGMRVGKSASDQGNKVFYNIDVNGEPVATSIFTGGLEYQAYVEQLEASKGLMREEWDQLFLEKRIAVVPGLVASGCVESICPAGVYIDGKKVSFEEVRGLNLSREVMGALNFSLAYQSFQLLQRIGVQKGEEVAIEGGFIKNEMWKEILKSFFPDNTLVISNMTEAGCLGAALLIGSLQENLKSVEKNMAFTVISAGSFDHLQDYLHWYEKTFIKGE